MISKYLETIWVKDGMQYPYLNCWGLVRLVRQELYGLPLLPAFAINADNKRELTIAAHEVVRSHLVEGLPEKGSIAAVWCKKLCIHVGVVIEVEKRLAVLDIGSSSGAQWVRLPDFEAKYLKVTYYNDKNIS